MINRWVGLLVALSSIGVGSLLFSEFPVLKLYHVPKYFIIIQPFILCLGAVFLGMYSYKRIAFLQLPFADYFLNKTPIDRIKIRKGLNFALKAILTGGVFFFLIAQKFEVLFSSLEKIIHPSWLTKLLYGGIAEEIIVRWGCTTFFLLILSKKFSPDKSFIWSVVLSSLLFGLGHIPMAMAAKASMTLVFLVLFSNFMYGLLFGYAFIKFGLWCAILCHLGAHLFAGIIQFIL